MNKEKSMEKAIAKVKWMREAKIWPNGQRYLWTDAHGVCALLTMYNELGDKSYLDQAEYVVAEVERVLGKAKGFRIGEEPDRNGQYFHYLTKWMFALNQLSKVKPEYHARAVRLVKDVHSRFVIPGVGVHWKMLEDLSASYPGYGLGGLDYYDGYVQYKLLDPAALSCEIGHMHDLVENDYRHFSCTQDLGLGESLWMSHFFPDEPWAKVLRDRSEKTLERMWIDMEDNEGYFCRQPGHNKIKYAFANYGISYGLQSVELWPDRCAKINDYFANHRTFDAYDGNSITPVMFANSLAPGVLI